MNLSASKHLRIASLLEILLGLASLAAIRGLLGMSALPDLSTSAAKGALFSLVLLYAANGFKIFSGIIGIAFAKRKSRLTLVLGLLLFLAQLVNFIQAKGDIFQIIVNIILLAIPYYYLHNAVRVYRSHRDRTEEA